MAKSNKTDKDKNVSPRTDENNVNENSNSSEQENVNTDVNETETDAETKGSSEETVQLEPVDENSAEEVIADVTPKDAFVKAVYSNDGKYVLVSNGRQLCSYLNKPVLAFYEDYFELNNIRYSYAGMEVKHID